MYVGSFNPWNNSGVGIRIIIRIYLIYRYGTDSDKSKVTGSESYCLVTEAELQSRSI